jgi:Holliday junction resolvase RusA-like endonuclease
MVRFTIFGKPQGKGRPRVVHNNRFTGKSMAYTPEKTSEYESLIRYSFQAAGGEMKQNAVFGVSVYAYFTPPTSWSKKKKMAAECGLLKPTTKPDCDNILKVVMDALNGVAWSDDKDVVTVFCMKQYDETARLEVEINEMRWVQHE